MSARAQRQRLLWMALELYEREEVAAMVPMPWLDRLVGQHVYQGA